MRRARAGAICAIPILVAACGAASPAVVGSVEPVTPVSAASQGAPNEPERRSGPLPPTENAEPQAPPAPVASAAEPIREPPTTPPQPAPPPDKAQRLFDAAASEYKLWDPQAGDTGANKQKRLAALESLGAYYLANRSSAAAAKYVVEAAFAIGTMKKAAGDATYRVWFRNTISAWDDYRAKAPLRNGKSEAQLSPYVDHAAEAELRLLDERIVASYENAEHHKYSPNIADIVGEVEIDPRTKKAVIGPDGRPKLKTVGKYSILAAEAQKWDLELDKLIRKYESREWVVIATERQGSLFDTLRVGFSGLTNVNVLYPQEAQWLQAMRATGRPDLLALANSIQAAKNDFWRQKRQLELDGCDTVMVKRYATAIALARAHDIRNAQVTRARARLGFYTDVLGDERMAELVEATPDPATNGATKLTYKARQYVQAP